MTERERMLSGQLYDAGDETLTAARGRAKRLTWRYHQLDPTDWDSRTQILQELLGHLGEDSWIAVSYTHLAGATVPLTGFGHALAKGVREAVAQKGWLGVLTGGLTATAGGITAAVVFGVVMAAIFKPGDKR